MDLRDKITTNPAHDAAEGILGRRLLISIILFSSLITLILTAVQLYFDYRRDVSSIDSLMDQVGEVYIGALEYSLWSLDDQEARIMVEGMVKLPDISYIEIWDGEEIWVSAGTKPELGFVEADYPLYEINAIKSESSPIGRLQVFATLELVYERLIDRAISLLIANGIKTIIVAGFILLFVNWLITRHLRKASNYLRQHNIDNTAPLRLHRQIPFSASRDEIDMLIEGINTMRSDLQRSFQQQNEVEKEFRTLSAWQRAALDAADYSVISTDVNGVIATFNKKAEKILGYSADEVIGIETPAIIHEENEVITYAEQLSREFKENIAPGFEVFVRKAREGLIDEREWTYIHKDGSHIPVFLSVTALRSETDEIMGFLGIASDLTERKAILADLEKSETLYENLFDNAGDAIVLLNDQGILIDCNNSALKLFDYPRHKFIGKRIAEFSPREQSNGRTSRQFGLEVSAKALERGQYVFEWLHDKRDGTLFQVEVSLSRIDIDGSPYLQGIIRDITERKHLEQELAYQAGHDSLTSLANRKTLHESFPEHLEKAKQSGWNLVMMLLDLDRFKDINDTLGHHYGDEVLNQVGPRLREHCTEEMATIARLGGDEFALLVTSDQPIEAMELMAENIVQALCKPFDAAGFKVTVGASLGMAIYPQHGTDSHDLLRASDVAMYAAKGKPSGVLIYDEKIDQHSTKRLQLANELKQAIALQELVLHYQPKINLGSGKISGFEALVRWQHPREGLLFPDSFIDLVEMSEIIHPFTKQVVELAMADKKKMQAMGIDHPIAINLSARNLIDDSYITWIKSELDYHDLPSSSIEIEITESAVMQDPENSVRLLEKVSREGVKISIDDFGTGHSSLTYLRKLPVSTLKIDRSFVMNMSKDEQNQAIVRSTIILARNLGLKVIAEGVEDDQTLTALTELECEEAQGYGICRPIPFNQLIQWIEQRDKLTA